MDSGRVLTKISILVEGSRMDVCSVIFRFEFLCYQESHPEVFLKYDDSLVSCESELGAKVNKTSHVESTGWRKLRRQWGSAVRRSL